MTRSLIKIGCIKYNVEFTTRELDSNTDPTGIVDTHTTLDKIYLLRESHQVDIYNLELIHLRTLELTKTNVRCLRIFADSHTLMVGYEDGTMELHQIGEDFALLRVTSTKDAGGPGLKRIDQIAASPDFVLVQTYENGLMIYTKPSLLFYKWIMLGGHCEISNFSIKDNILYVLVERPEHEIHMLDFEKHRIFEQEVHAYTFVDIEFDGLYLYAATSTSVLVYLQEEAERPMKQERIAQLNFNERISHLLTFQDEIYVVFTDHMVSIERKYDHLDSNSGKASGISHPQISSGDRIDIPGTQVTRKLKYDYYSSQPHENFAKSRSMIYLDESHHLRLVNITA